MSKVTIYTTPTCGFCHMAKEYFKQNEVDYKEVDVSQDQKAAELLVRKTGQLGVPVIEVDDQVIIGFNQPKLAAALGL